MKSNITPQTKARIATIDSFDDIERKIWKSFIRIGLFGKIDRASEKIAEIIANRVGQTSEVVSQAIESFFAQGLIGRLEKDPCRGNPQSRAIQTSQNLNLSNKEVTHEVA